MVVGRGLDQNSRQLQYSAPSQPGGGCVDGVVITFFPGVTMALKPLYKRLYFQVLVVIVIGVALGALYPQSGAAMKPR